MPIQMTCTGCGRTLQVKEEWAGRTGRCPHCGAAIRIPEPRPELAAAPPHPPVSAAPYPPAARAPEEVVSEPFEPAAPQAAAEPAGTFLTSALDGLLRGVRVSRPDGFHRYLDALCQVGLFSLLAAGGLILIDSIVGAVQAKDFAPVWMGLGVMLGAVVLHYVSAKFATAGLRLITTEPQAISSRSFMDCAGFLLSMVTVALLVSGVIGAFHPRHSLRAPGMSDSFAQPQSGFDVTGLITALGTCVIMAHVAIAAVSEKVLNMTLGVTRGAAGEEALGIIAYIARLNVIAGRAVLGIGAPIGAAAVLWLSVALWLGKPSSAAATTAAVSFVLVAGLATLAVYVYYVMIMLFVDVCRAVFRIARNTDK